MLALLGALSLFAAAQAQAQTTVWSGTITVGNGVGGCGLTQSNCSSLLSDYEFTYGGVTYEITRFYTASDFLIVELDKAFPSKFWVVHVGTRQFSLQDASFTNGDKRARWSNTGLNWAAGASSRTVSLSLVEPPTPTEYSVTLTADNLRPIEGLTVTLTATLDNPARAGGATLYFIKVEGSASTGSDFTWSMPDRSHCEPGRQCNPTPTQPISINQGDTTVTTTLMVIDDAEGENDETIVIGVRSSLTLTSHPRLTLTIPANTGRTDNTPTDTGGPGNGGGGGGFGGGGGPSTPTGDDETPREDEEPSTSCSEEDREILRSFYEMTDGENWHENENWNSAEPLGEWHGVDTDEDGNVVFLRLSGNGLSGDMPTEELLCLTELVELALWDNDDLSGEVPEELVLAVERAALRDIAETLNVNPEWFEDYEEPYDFEDWHEGVTIDEDGRVTELDLTGEGVTGEIPGNIYELLPRLGGIMVTRSSGDGGCAVGASSERMGASALLAVILILLALSRGLRARFD